VLAGDSGARAVGPQTRIKQGIDRRRPLSHVYMNIGIYELLILPLAVFA